MTTRRPKTPTELGFELLGLFLAHSLLAAIALAGLYRLLDA